MIKKIFFTTIAFLFLSYWNVNAQLSGTDNISSDNYELDLMRDLIVDSINTYRNAGGGEALSLDDVLSSAAGDQADYMMAQ